MNWPLARRFVGGAFVFAAALLVSTGHVDSKTAIPTDEAAIVHALERLTFGATTRDIARVQQMGQAGLSRWLDAQLAPASIDDRAMQARLAGFATLTLPSRTIAEEYERPARQERRRAQRASTTAEGETTDTAMRGRSAVQMKNRLVVSELSEAKLLRAVYSERQLEEVLVDFWFNHFNVFAGKGQTRVYLTAYERDSIRPHVFGHFRELLGATAKSPAMLFYLDNWISSAPGGSARPRRSGLNENYARELLELHTLGVDGGYTQTDIVNVARAFTGWTIRLRDERSGGQVRREERFGGQVRRERRGSKPVESGTDEGFHFAPAMHDSGAKTVLGETIKAGGGVDDGERVLDIVATHPSTARFIATKLARRFVSDQPPAALVERAAATFRTTHGDLRAVVRTIITSPEFFAVEARDAKIKTPLEFVASALRATDATIEQAAPLIRALRELGMPVYFCQPPTGYDDTAATWVSSGALVARMNFAVDLANNRLRGIAIGNLGHPEGWPSTGNAPAKDAITHTLLFNRVSDSTAATMAKATTPAQTLALAIGSPEFQRR